MFVYYCDLLHLLHDNHCRNITRIQILSGLLSMHTRYGWISLDFSRQVSGGSMQTGWNTGMRTFQELNYVTLSSFTISLSLSLSPPSSIGTILVSLVSSTPSVGRSSSLGRYLGAVGVSIDYAGRNSLNLVRDREN